PITTAFAIGNEYVQESIVVVVAPRRSVEVANLVDDLTVCDFSEGAVAIVAVQRILLSLSLSDEKVKVTVIVIIPPGRTDRQSHHHHSRPRLHWESFRVRQARQPE